MYEIVFRTQSRWISWSYGSDEQGWKTKIKGQ